MGDRKGAVYNSRKLLISCEFAQLERRVGVFVDEPFEHRGLCAECVEVYCEEVTVNTRTVGTTVVTADWRSVAIGYTTRIIGRLDGLIAELQGHRDRLAKELERLEVPDAIQDG